MATSITGRSYEIPPNIRKMLESKLAIGDEAGARVPGEGRRLGVSRPC